MDPPQKLQQKSSSDILIYDINKPIQKRKFILMTYRSQISPIQKTTYYTSDSGWGCMLRVGQMFIANLLFIKEKLPFLSIIQMFYDNLMVAFSIQNMTRISNQILQYKKQYEWFSPCQVGFVIKKMLEEFDSFYSVNICNDNSIFLSEICTERQKIVIMIMTRIGLEQPQPGYLNCVFRLMKSKFFFAILGGTPKRAHLFLYHDQKNKKLGYLDPHTTNKSIPTFNQIPQHSEQYISKLQWIKQTKIDSSMSIAFVLQRNQLNEFWSELQKLKKEIGEDFFIYMDKEKPVFDQNDMGIVEIDSDFEDQYDQQLK